MTISEEIIVDIMRSELLLSDNHVWIRNQNRTIDIDNDLYVVVGMVDSKIISNVNTITPTATGMTELQQVSMRENIQIDIFSKTNDASLRRAEVLAALQSFYSKQKQEENNFKIFQIPTTFVNASSAEGGSNINRFTIVIACHALFSKEKVLQSDSGDYFDEFKTRFDNEDTVGTPNGLFEFTEN